MSALIMLRHIRTSFNVEGRLQGSLDIALEDVGHAQAVEVARRLVAAHGDVRVVSSPLARARQTAQAVAAAAHTDFAIDEAFTQRTYGVWEGLTWDEVRQRWPEEFARRQNGLEPRIDGWGSSADVAARVLDGMERWWDPQRPTVVVSHGGAIQLGVMASVGLEPASRTLGKVAHGSWHVVSRSDIGTWHINQFGVGAD